MSTSMDSAIAGWTAAANAITTALTAWSDKTQSVQVAQDQEVAAQAALTAAQEQTSSKQAELDTVNSAVVDACDAGISALGSIKDVVAPPEAPAGQRIKSVEYAPEDKAGISCLIFCTMTEGG